MPTYYPFGYQKRYAFQWNAGQSGVMWPTKAPASSSLGAADLLESGYGDPSYEPYPALQKYQTCAASVQKPCGLRATASAQLAGVGDWPLKRSSGPEPESLGLIALSDNEKLLAVGAAAVLGYFLWKRSKRSRRRNPARRNPWAVKSTTRGVTGQLVFMRKKDAKAYAAERRSSGKPATVARYSLRRKRR